MVLYFDTETTSLTPGSICQLSYIMQEGDKVNAKNFFFEVDWIEPSASFIHGLTVSKLKALSNGKKFSDYIEEIESDFNKASIIVSHNFNFDYMFLRTEFDRNNKVFTFNDSFCSMRQTVSVCKLPKKKGLGYKLPKLNEVCNYCNIDEESIAKVTSNLFGSCSSYHDARFDTTALFLAVNNLLPCEPALEKIKKAI